MHNNHPEVPLRERLIFALDVASLEEAQTLISTLGDTVQFYKLGLEVFLAVPTPQQGACREIHHAPPQESAQ